MGRDYKTKLSKGKTQSRMNNGGARNSGQEGPAFSIDWIDQTSCQH
jgi:hypothetical protein